MQLYSNFIKNLPIAKKLTLFCVTTSIISLVIAMTAIIIYDRYNFTDIITEELSVLALTISNRSSAAIIFDDRELALNNLNTLKSKKAIATACMYKINAATNDRAVLAAYPNDSANCPTSTPQNTYIATTKDGKYIEIIQPIILDKEIIGYLFLQSTSEELQERLANHFFVLLIVSIFASLIAFWFANVFARRHSRPLRSLENTARIIAEEDDYSIRAKRHSNDEVGQVVDAFNYMLEVIQQEDADLRESEEKFRLISESSKVGIFQISIDRKCVYANEELGKITELSVDYILENNWISTIHHDDKKRIKHQWETLLEDHKEMNLSCRLNCNGHIKWINGYVGVLKSANQDLIGYLGTITDITDVKNAQVQLEHMAFYDTLTGLANRRLFRNRLEHVINNFDNDDSMLGLILLDLDNFKEINDSLGHDSGDALLTLIAERLQQCVRASDTVGRLGGDEFAIILPNIKHTRAASTVAEKVLASLEKPIILQEVELRITASIGISIAPEHSTNAEHLMKNADLALYDAKDQGRNNYQFFTKEMNIKLVEHVELIRDLRYAVEAQEFFLVFQPQIDLKKNIISGFEALIRWEHSKRGFVSPIDFIPAAEETGLIIPLGRWVITAACQQLRNMLDNGTIDNSVVMTVNLSVKQFQDHELVNFITSTLQDFQLNPSQFEFELTETVIMENIDDVIEKLERLKELGILISIDDFGTGYSSLGYLKRLPVNIVKVDRSFVMDIPHDEDDMAITAAVIAMAHNLNYEVVAEGVETLEQLRFLEQCDCDYGQGYFFSKPLPSAEIEAFCNNFEQRTIISA